MPTQNSSTTNPAQLFKQSAPILVTRYLAMGLLQFFAKRIILGQKSESVLAAYAIIGIIESLVFILVFSGLHIVSARISQLHADEMKASAQRRENTFDPKIIGETYRQGVLFGILLMLPTTAICFAAPTLFSWLGQSEMIVAQSAVYLRYGLFAYWADMLYRTQARVVIGLSQPKIALIADSAESILDVVLTYFFVNGKYGFPDMGVEGAAVAYAISAATTATGTFFYLHTHVNFQRYELFRNEFLSAYRSPQFNELVCGGLHLSLKTSILPTTQMITKILFGSRSNAPLAAIEVVFGYSAVASLFVAGFSEAASIVIGRLAEHHSAEAIQIGNYSMCGCFTLTVLLALPAIMQPQSIVRLFLNAEQHPLSFSMARVLLQIQAVMEIINSISNTGSDVLLGFLETRGPFLLSAIFICAFNSTLLLIAHFLFHLDPLMLYGLQLTGMTLNTVGVAAMWWMRPWKKCPAPESPKDAGRVEELQELTDLTVVTSSAVY
ncbi:MAG: hypothetical protein A3I77_01415 [Gammaproteobacteria bacterium RIFCSPLOWO2_02_FULL_42_14]|nr:MAG: hypothetical protein A3B71_07600 [Gammaproteobacteria bacterium RIFCSPHIGHO2_02_FULL_42_43]OGT29213.1 MAG: hypothetical protein A2624_07175 [Gammaproteobacteria bacterium RIFCSPHIGHO2_01_FULL_42_8]OGT52286.1 MAG: hypothetical protein A3E54_01475 [Gammaproteobacteria bacterium RIFCSPHIGHO2_12_FULL_41_25]OGT61899.1 MAG: hypothetical protein A3I77_01415 [Gammaproteobacteria bacterium RIFCSPLOWO2_02_FULL_42_14]OGT86391.1 MAG: hypothetical protein A3G86_07680 [Gammaproteobacteria bacterium R